MFWSPGHSSQSVPLFSQDPVIFLLIIVGIRYLIEKEVFEEKCDIVRQGEYMLPFTPNMGNNWKLPTVTTCLNAKFRVYRSRQSSWWKKFAKLFSFVLLKQHKWLNLTIIKTQNWTKAIWNLLNYILLEVKLIYSHSLRIKLSCCVSWLSRKSPKWQIMTQLHISARWHQRSSWGKHRMMCMNQTPLINLLK